MQPRVRAKWARDSAASLDALTGPLGDAARAHVTAATLADVRDAWPMGWIDVEKLVEIDDAICGALGARLYEQHCRRAIRAALSWPLLAPLMRATTRIFEGGRAAPLRMLPDAFELVFRDCGILRSHIEPTSATVRLLGPPSLVIGSPSFRLGISGAIAASLEAVHLKPKVEIEERPDQLRFSVAY